MLLEQVYLLFIYILFIELAMVTVVAIALFVALVVTMRKLDNEKNTSLLDRQRCILYKNTLNDTPHFCGISSFYNYYTQNIQKSQIIYEKIYKIYKMCLYYIKIRVKSIYLLIKSLNINQYRGFTYFTTLQCLLHYSVVFLFCIFGGFKNEKN